METAANKGKQPDRKATPEDSRGSALFTSCTRFRASIITTPAPLLPLLVKWCL